MFSEFVDMSVKLGATKSKAFTSIVAQLSEILEATGIFVTFYLFIYLLNLLIYYNI